VRARPDVIMATGRSDYPNQVNNVLGFPFIFRGALDVRATAINDEMKLAATEALAALAKPGRARLGAPAYGVERMEFGRGVHHSQAVRPRVLIWEAAAVARAAMESGVAQQPIDLEEYREQLERRLGKAHEVMRVMINKAKREPKRVVFPEGEADKILRACQILMDEQIAFRSCSDAEGIERKNPKSCGCTSKAPDHRAARISRASEYTTNFTAAAAKRRHAARRRRVDPEPEHVSAR
jgi:malate dehydrogenase (oxaloacetate-decarboxylating)(NADP+)